MRSFLEVRTVMGTTVGDVNKAFKEKKMAIELPYPEDWEVKDLQILEKKDTAVTVKVLLAIELIRHGKVIRDMCYLEGEIERDRPESSGALDIATKKTHLLPVRNRSDFVDDAEAVEYLHEAFASLLIDNDYVVEDHPEADLYGKIGSRGFFLMLAPRCDEGANNKAKQLIGLRKTYKHMHDYGLVVPAFQEPLGLSLSQQEGWVMAQVEALSTHRIGVYGVDNSDPNRIYPFTIYPQVRGLLRYFVTSSRQWQDVRTQYLMSRGNQ